MSTKEPQKEPELIIETGAEVPEKTEETAERPPKSGKESVLAEIKKQASEDDTPVKGKRRLRDIVGGDFLTALVRRHIWLILLTVLLTTCYIAVRYQCQQDQIDIARLEKETNEMKFKALSSSSNLTIMCRQSHLEELLRANQDSLIKINMQPPFIINTSEK